MHPAEEALLFLLHQAKKHAVHPRTEARAAALIARLEADVAPELAPIPHVVRIAPLASLISSAGAAPGKEVEAK